jgi:D-alanine--D-alanine ligase
VKKLRVGVIFGGRSGEHEVSIASAAAIFKHLDPARYDAVPIKIAKDGRWALTGDTPKALSAADVHKQTSTEALVAVDPSAALEGSGLDVVFPVLHGPYGEDGTVQGLLELANVPYVGCGVLGSAAGMDKAVMKKLFSASGLPVGPYVVALRREWDRDASAVRQRVVETLGYPVCVKPANLGSSVGISAVTTLLVRNTQIMHSQLAEHVTPFNDGLTPLSPGVPTTAHLAAIDATVTQQAAMIAYNNDFKLMLILTVVAIPLVVLLRAPRSAAAPGQPAIAE